MGIFNEIKILTLLMEGTEIDMLREVIKKHNISSIETEIEPNKIKFKLKVNREQKYHVNMLLGYLELYD